MWFGRVVFGVGGWFLFIFAFTVVPVLLMCLLVSTILAFNQPGRPRALTRGQAGAQWATWLAMFLFGALALDFSDAPRSETSLLIRVFGYSEAMVDLSYNLMLALAGVTVLAWLALLVTLTAGRRKAA